MKEERFCQKYIFSRKNYRNKKSCYHLKIFTCGSGFVHDLRFIIVPPPHVTLTFMPSISRKQGVATVDQGDQPPLIVIIPSLASDI